MGEVVRVVVEELHGILGGRLNMGDSAQDMV